MNKVQQKYTRIILGYRAFPPEEQTPQLIYFCYLLRSIYESKTTAPDEMWPGIRDVVGPPILDLLRSDEETREEVFYVGPAVKMIPPLDLTAAIPILRHMLDSRDVYLCRLAIEALGELGDTESIPDIRKRLEPRARPGHFGGGDDMTTPQYAAAALWKMGDAEARRILSEHLVHPAQSVRVQAAIAFAEMGDATGIRVLESRLQNPGAFRIPVLDALSHLDHPRAAELLEREMNVGDMRGRLLAALYLAERRSAAARKFLLNTARGSDLNNAYSATIHLARLDDGNAIPLLEVLSFQVDPEQRLAAAAALAWMGSRFGYEELIRTLESEEWSYRAIAAAMLLMLEQGSPEAG
jgi:HEAT repeat protein